MNENENNQDPRFCVFRSQQDTFALAANHVKSVSPHPEVTQVPVNDDSMIGLAYIQKDFIPVFELCRLMNSGAVDVNSKRQLLTVSLDDCDFGLLVDQVLGLEPLEISYSGRLAGQKDWNSVLTGSATYRDQFVSVIDPVALAQLLADRLQTRWEMFDKHDSIDSKVVTSH